MSTKYKEAVKIGVNKDGKPIIKWASGNTKEQLHRRIAEILIENKMLEEGKTETAPPGNNPEWEEYVSTWFNVFHKYKVRENVLSKDTTILHKHLVPMFKGKRLKAITPMEIQKQLNEREKLSKSYLRDIICLMHQVFDSAIEDGITMLRGQVHRHYASRLFP